MMCLSSFCEHCKRIISTNKYARFDRTTRYTTHTVLATSLSRSHNCTTAAQTHTSANPDGKDATSVRLPHMSKRITARTTDEPGGTVQAGAQRTRRSLECAAQHASEAHPAGSSKRSAAIAAAARRWPRPAACAQPRHQRSASSSKKPATTTRTTMQPVSSAAASVCKRRRQKFHFRGAYGRQGERGARAHTVVWSVA